MCEKFLDIITPYKKPFERCSENYAKCMSEVTLLSAELADAENTIEQMKLLLPKPIPPKLTNVVSKDTVWIDSVLLNMKAKVIRLPLSKEFLLTNKTTFMEFIAWDWVDGFE